jgi:predicted aldo/keto reductase-like oxidoreductase
MRKKRLGKANIEVSVIGLGGIPLQRLTEEQAGEVVKEAVDSGINFIDTARGYTVSEEYIGAALEKYQLRDRVYLATKTMVRDYEGMKTEIEISLQNLRTDYIDLYQAHLIKTEEQYVQFVGEDGGYRALVEAKEAGKIGAIGITAHTASLLEKFMDPEKFDTIQFPYNPIENQGKGLFERAHAHDMGVIVMKPIAGGAFGRGDLSLKYIMQNETITVAIPGMDSVEQVRQNAAIGSDETALSIEEKTEIQGIVDRLGSEFCRRCGYCLPCPQGIDIPTQFLFEGYLTRYDMKDWAVGRYEVQVKNASDCVECGICETRCPYNLPIRKMLKRVVQAF